MFGVSAVLLFEMRRDERVVDFSQCARKLFAVLPAPFLPPDQPSDLTSGERNFHSNRSAVVRVLLNERDENLVGELTWLSEFWIGSNDDAFLGVTPIEFYLCRA